MGLRAAGDFEGATGSAGGPTRRPGCAVDGQAAPGHDAVVELGDGPARPAAARRSRRPGSARRRAAAAARAGGSSTGTVRPVWPCGLTQVTPLWGMAALRTGQPLAIASTCTRPNASLRALDGNHKRLGGQVVRHDAGDGSPGRPRGRRRPRRAASASSAGRSGPSPASRSVPATRARARIAVRRTPCTRPAGRSPATAARRGRRGSAPPRRGRRPRGAGRAPGRCRGAARAAARRRRPGTATRPRTPGWSAGWPAPAGRPAAPGAGTARRGAAGGSGRCDRSRPPACAAGRPSSARIIVGLGTCRWNRSASAPARAVASPGQTSSLATAARRRRPDHRDRPVAPRPPSGRGGG